jgi:hypothetical protein
MIPATRAISRQADTASRREIATEQECSVGFRFDRIGNRSSPRDRLPIDDAMHAVMGRLLGRLRM